MERDQRVPRAPGGRPPIVAMILTELKLRRFRSFREQSVPLQRLNLFIGANASGKSALLDALRFLGEAVRSHSFHDAVATRGGILHLAWKGESAHAVETSVTVRGEATWEWRVRLLRKEYDFVVEENVQEIRESAAPVQLLAANAGSGWWWSGERRERVSLRQSPKGCALAAAAADASFPARGLAEFARRWGFFDPNPFLLRRDWAGMNGGGLDPYGRNLAETLHAMHQDAPETLNRIVDATRAIVGAPLRIEPRESEGRFYFVQHEEGLRFPVHQIGASSGTLRMLALMTALLGDAEAKLVGMEEPENYLHPAALEALMEHVAWTSDRVQFVVTTHAPFVLDVVGDPSAVRVVRRDADNGTTVGHVADPEGLEGIELLRQGGVKRPSWAVQPPSTKSIEPVM